MPIRTRVGNGGPSVSNDASPQVTRAPAGRPAVSYAPRGEETDNPAKNSTLPDWWGILGMSVTSPNMSALANGPADETAYLPVVYGVAKLQPTALTFWEESMIRAYGLVAVGEGEISSIDHFYINNVEITTFDDPDGQRGQRMYAYTGAAGDTLPTNWTWYPAPDPDLPGWTPKPAYVYWELKGFASGAVWHWWRYLYQYPPTEVQLNYLVEVHGRKVYDPRTGLTAFSDNPALIYRDLYVTYGKVPAGSMNDTSIAAAAEICEDIGLTCNIVFNEKATLENAINEVLLTCNGVRVITDGKIGLWIDQANADPPVATVSEEEGTLVDIYYEWLSTVARPTEVTVTFPNAAANFKDDSYVVRDPGIDDGSVPLRQYTVQIRGCTSLDQAHILADYIFNSSVISLRIRGRIAFQGAVLAKGMKIGVKTLAGVDAEFLIEQIDHDESGLYPAVLKPYDEDVYGTTPITGGPPIVPPPPVDPGTQPPAITVVAYDRRRTQLASVGSNTQTTNGWVLVDYTVPSGTAAVPTQIVVRGFVGTGAASKTWNDMVNSEITIPLAGNEPPSPTFSTLSHPSLITDETVTTYDRYGRVIAIDVTTTATRLMIKTETPTGVKSNAVTIDIPAGTSHNEYGQPDIALYKWVPATEAANGTRKTFSVPDKPVAGSLVVVADGQTLVDSTFNPVQGADYSYSNRVVTIASGRAAPLSYVALFYQVSNEPD